MTERVLRGVGTAAKWIVPTVGALVVLTLALVAILLLGGGSEPTVASPAPRFVDETQASGIAQVYDGDWTFYVGGGVAAFDCNEDALPDLYIAGGENRAGLYVNGSDAGGGLMFTDATDENTGLDRVTGAYPIDIDSDGIGDLVILRNGPNAVLRGTGGCSFEQAPDSWNITADDAWTTAFSATWEQGNEFPTLAFGNYVLLDDRGFQNGDCFDNALLRPVGSRYEDVTGLVPGWCTLSMLFSDWSRTGQRDLRVSNDRHYYRNGEEQLWAMPPGAEPYLYGEADGWRSIQIFGMGIASHDTDGDRLPEVFLTSQGDNKLQTLAVSPSRPDYTDIAIRSGVTAHRPYTGGDVMPSTAWHPAFRDVNNDGFIDLYISKGNVDADPGYATADPNNLLLGQADGTFTESAEEAGLVTFSKTRGAALVDLNLDGFLDLVEVNREENVRVWRNTGASAAEFSGSAHWLMVSLAQPAPNRDAIGAWIEVRIGDHLMSHEVTVGGGHVSGELGPVHFGLGSSSAAEVRVIWPDGLTGDWITVEADRVATVLRGSPDRVVENEGR